MILIWDWKGFRRHTGTRDRKSERKHLCKWPWPFVRAIVWGSGRSCWESIWSLVRAAASAQSMGCGKFTQIPKLYQVIQFLTWDVGPNIWETSHRFSPPGPNSITWHWFKNVCIGETPFHFYCLTQLWLASFLIGTWRIQINNQANLLPFSQTSFWPNIPTSIHIFIYNLGKWL